MPRQRNSCNRHVRAGLLGALPIATLLLSQGCDRFTGAGALRADRGDYGDPKLIHLHRGSQ